jgi:hypothetical protein
MPEPIMILVSVYIMAPYSILNASHQSASGVATQLLDEHVLAAMNT